MESSWDFWMEPDSMQEEEKVLTGHHCFSVSDSGRPLQVTRVPWMWVERPDHTHLEGLSAAALALQTDHPSPTKSQGHCLGLTVSLATLLVLVCLCV